MQPFQCHLRIGQIHQAKPAENDIEALFRQVGRLGIHLAEVDVLESQLRCQCSTEGEHLRSEVGGDDMA